ncbi:hypothetical protein METHB2_160044 [Candidatus Methylobacter favarea]|uniref:Uncharacterized protein n=1 Tax=Candidatus Methylobacter favarea TaxID=2707345 RepID=A0A8S0X7E1_9GAMM|nr:hypothetical protein [Candidatus Methylobacter favarea]CAA9889977.1 hypothetical protein METHB2_160044 [Candidatus Methylobacter favarea]
MLSNVRNRGTQADLARMLGISRSAVSSAFRKHNIQLAIDGKKFDLDYAAWLLKEKQNQVKSRAQRAAPKQLPGLKNPKTKREIIRSLWEIWNQAVIDTLKNRAEISLESQEDKEDLTEWLFALSGFWHAFHDICDKEFPPDISDFPFRKPDALNFSYPENPLDIIIALLACDVEPAEAMADPDTETVPSPAEGGVSNG